MPRTITNDELKAAARKAIDDGTLLALKPGYTGKCVYRLQDGKRTYKCAIGAALNGAEAAKIKRLDWNEDTDVLTLAWKGIVEFESRKFARDLQCAHDEITKPASAAERDGAIASFKSLIDYPEAGAV